MTEVRVAEFAENELDGCRIAFERVGEGPPLVCVHGTALSSRLWHALGYVERLALDNELVLIDLRGHGQSDGPTNQRDYAMHLLIGDVVAVLDAAALPSARYFGYSLGGRVGLGLAINERGRVDGLIVGGASHRPQRGALDRIVYPGFATTIERDGMEAFLSAWAHHLGRDVPEATRRVFLKADPRALVPLLRQIDTEPGFDLAALSSVNVPTLLFAGEHDRERLNDSREAVSALPDAHFAVVPGGDHLGTLALTDEVCDLVESFLRQR